MDTQSIGLADTLELLLQGKLSASEFRRRHPIQETSNGLEPVLANIEHFLADADIRVRDQKYRVMQEGEMARLISALRSGDVDIARQVHFLGR